MPSHFLTHEAESSKGSRIFHEISLFIRVSLFILPFVFLFSCALPYTTPKWIVTLLSLCFIITIFLYNTSILYLPRLKSSVFWGFFLVVSLLFVNSYFQNTSLISLESMRRFLFLGAILFFFNFFRACGAEEFVKAKSAIFVASGLFVVAALVQYVFYPWNPPYLTFGNINLAAEFIGFSFALQFGTLLQRWKNDQSPLLLTLLSVLSLTYLYITFCRSIWIGIVCMFIAALFLKKKVAKRIIKIFFLCLLFVFLVNAALVVSTFFFHVSSQEIFCLHNVQAAKSFSVRWVLYLDTLKMILKNPWGVGIGQFEFASLPYVNNLFPGHNEQLIFLSPHNEFLHFLAEDGLPLSCAVFVFIISLVVTVWVDIKRIFSAYPEFIFFSIMLFVQSLFQFPLIDPFPYFLTALMIGYFFSLQTTTPLSCHLTVPLRYGLLTLIFGMTVVFCVSFSTQYAALNFPEDERINKVACAYGNRNWQACLNLSVFYGKKGEYAEAEHYARRTVQWQPLNFQGMKTLGFALLPQGKTREACTLLEEYDGFFQKQSSLHPLIQKECSLTSQAS